jgi:hypothetical protein
VEDVRAATANDLKQVLTAYRLPKQLSLFDTGQHCAVRGAG